jgi:hypothetical protein
MRFENSIVMLIPLTVFLEQLSLIIVTKGLAQIDPPTPTIGEVMDYVYLASVYGNALYQISKRILEGIIIHLTTTNSLTSSIILIILKKI